MKIVFPRLYAILSADLISSSESALAEKLAQAGVELIQYRNKKANSQALFGISPGILRALDGYTARLILNDRADVARLVGAGGVHVGQEDLPVDAARAVGRRLGASDFWVGVSTHTLDQVREAETTSADYIAVGPVFPTTTKERPDAVIGTDFIRRARALTTKPIVAIGGITVEHAAEVFSAGADCVAVARDLICAEDPAAKAIEYLAIAKNFRS